MYNPDIPKIIFEDSSFLSSMEEDYEEIFTVILPSMKVDVSLLDRFYSGSYKFNDNEAKNLMTALNKIVAGRLNEFIFFLINEDYDVDSNDLSVKSVINEVKKSSKNPYVRAIEFGYLDIFKYLTTRDNINVNNYIDLIFAEAAKKGHLHILKYLIESGGKVDIHFFGNYAFIQAARYNHLDVLKYLISLESTHGSIDSKALSDALENSVIEGDLSTVTYLVGLGDKNHTLNIDRIHNFVMEKAARYGHLDVLKYLISLYSERTNSHINIKNLLEEAASEGHLHIVEYLKSLESKYGKIDMKGIIEDILVMSSRRGHLNSFRYFTQSPHVLEMVQYPNFDSIIVNIARLGELDILKDLAVIRANLVINLAFPQAIIYGQVNILKYLISICHIHNEGDVYAKNIDKMKLAASNGHLDTIKYLISLDTDKNKITKLLLDDSLLKAAFFGHLHIIEYLDKHVKYSNVKLTEAFKEAARNGYLHILEYLIGSETADRKINIHQNEEYAFTWAAFNGHLHILKYLISLEGTHDRINIHIRNENAFTLAATHGHLHILKYLISLESTHGSIDIHFFGDQVFKDAALAGHLHIIEYLISLEPTHGEINTKLFSESDFDEDFKKRRPYVIKYINELDSRK